MSQIYPKQPKPYVPNLTRRWRLDCDLIYGGDGGGYNAKWSKSYRTRIGAKLAAFYHYHLGSWGGSIEMTDQWIGARDE